MSSATTQDGPAFPEIGVLALVPDDWRDVWMPRHQVTSRLARYFNVVWVEPALGWRETMRSTSSIPVEPGIPGLTVYGPRWLPKVYRPTTLGRASDRLRLQRARRLLTRFGSRHIVLYLWRPNFAPALAWVAHDASLYHVDDEYSFSVVEQALDEREVDLLTSVDQVIIHSPALMEKKGHINPRTALVPNGVDFRRYSAVWPPPDEFKDIPRPIVGYAGVIKRQLDFELIRTLSERHPEFSFVLVGPCFALGRSEESFNHLLARPNVYWLGARPVDDLPRYTSHFDVCTMFYLENDYTKYIYPLKLHEYLATGRPVVGTPIRTLREFGEVVELARGADEWSAAILRCLSPKANTESAASRRRDVARRFDWDVLTQEIARLICGLLANGWRGRFEQHFGTCSPPDQRRP